MCVCERTEWRRSQSDTLSDWSVDWLIDWRTRTRTPPSRIIMTVIMTSIHPVKQAATRRMDVNDLIRSWLDGMGIWSHADISQLLKGVSESNNDYMVLFNYELKVYFYFQYTVWAI